MLDEFVAMVGCHRKHAVRLLKQGDKPTGQTVPKGQRIYDEAVREALTVVWEASDQDMREETEGGVAEHGGVAGEARSS